MCARCKQCRGVPPCAPDQQTRSRLQQSAPLFVSARFAQFDIKTSTRIDTILTGSPSSATADDVVENGVEGLGDTLYNSSIAAASHGGAAVFLFCPLFRPLLSSLTACGSPRRGSAGNGDKKRAPQCVNTGRPRR